MKRTVLALLCSFAILTPGAPANAWNDRGHMLIALVAYRRLGAAQKERVGKLLKAHPHFELFLSQDRPEGVSAEEWAFAKAATWPDFVRGEAYSSEFHRSKWHYVNTPFTPAREESLLVGPKFEVPRVNVIFAIEENLDVLADRAASDRRKAICLAWVEHLVGDVHQPLHCISLVTRAYPTGDRGGNSLAVRSGDSVVRLHAYWDNALGEDRDYASINKVAKSWLDAPPVAAEELAERAKKLNPQSWVDEGYAHGKEFVYLNGDLPVADYDVYMAGALAPAAVPTLRDDYRKTAETLSARRAAIAAHRLAAVLNGLFER